MLNGKKPSDFRLLRALCLYLNANQAVWHHCSWAGESPLLCSKPPSYEGFFGDLLKCIRTTNSWKILRNVFKTRSSCAMSMIPWVKPRIWFTMADYTTGKRDLINGHSTTFGKAWRLFGMFEVGWWKRRFWIIPSTVGHKWNKFHPIVSWGNLIGLVGHNIELHLALAVIWSMNSN